MTRRRAGSKYLSPILAVLWLVTGCAVTRTTQAIGTEYPVERVVSVRPGMAEAEVISLLGEPYARGKDPDGRTVLRYEYLVTTTKAMAAGIGYIGVTGSQSLSGGKATITIATATGTVTAVEYEIQGAERYEGLRGAGRAAGR